MATAITWISIAILVLFLGVGFGVGLFRGLKRSAFSAIFMVLSLILAYFITKPITNAILGASLTVDGTKYTISSYIMEVIQSSFNLSNLPTAKGFVSNLPAAIVSPIIFMLLGIVCSGIFSLIAMIFNRICFGKRKTDFEKHKPYRAYGALIGLVQGLILLVFVFAPITSLTNTYAEICANATTAQVQTLSSSQAKNLNTIGDEMEKALPKSVREAIETFNKGPVAKIAGLGGANNMMFDGMANFKVEGQKIKLRKELITTTNTYDQFVIVYNNIQNKTYSNIDTSKVKMALEDFMEMGIFKKVVVETVKDIVNDFDKIMADFNISKVSDDVKEIVANLKTSFETENVYEYLKHDILKFVDVIDGLFAKGVVSSFQNSTDKTFVGILDTIESKNTTIKNIAKDALSLNIVKDGISVFGKYANKEFSKVFENDKGLEFGLNLDVEDTDKLVDDFMDALDDFLSLNDKINLSKLIEGEDIVDTISSVNDIDGTLIQIGKTFDKMKNLEILTLPVEGERTEKVFVFDNILKMYDMNLLEEEVYLTVSAEEKTALTTYEAFFTYLAEPIDYAVELELTKIDEEDMTMETIIDNLVVGLAVEEDVISKIMLPFYQVKALDLKALVFDNIIDQLNSQAGDLVNFNKLNETGLTDKQKVQLWDGQFKLLGKALSAMSDGTITTQELGEKTYVKYLLTNDPDFELLLKEMLSDDKLSSCLDPIFEGIIFEYLTAKMFDEIDSIIGSSDFTGVKPATDLTNLKETKTEVIEIIETLLDKVLNSEEIGYVEIGSILDILKENAYNNGTKDGVFNNIFANIIWYMTGDVINGVDYTGCTPHENSADIKAYLAVENNDGYYVENYAETLKEIEDAVDFADKLSTALEGKSLDSVDDVQTYVDAVISVIDQMGTTHTDEEIAEIIGNTKTIIDNRGETLLDEQEKTDYGTAIAEAINTTFAQRTEIANGLNQLFDVA